MDYLRKASDRGYTDVGWLQSYHSFAFGSYFDAQHQGFSVLRVINDDVIAPASGFNTHGHRNMEIISYILRGSVTHTDSMGNQFTVSEGEIQHMSAGAGVRHAEHNSSPDQPLHLLQIWIEPNRRDITPHYAQATIEQQGAITPLVTHDGRGHSLKMQQDASICRVVLSSHETLEIPLHDRAGYIHVISGAATVNHRLIQQGDGLGLVGINKVGIQSQATLFEALWFDLPNPSIKF